MNILNVAAFCCLLSCILLAHSSSVSKNQIQMSDVKITGSGTTATVTGAVSVTGGKYPVMTATMSGTLDPASQCIDGDLTTLCHSDSKANSWLQLDLGSPQTIVFVRIYNRDTDEGDSQITSVRLGAHKLFIGNTANNPTANTECWTGTATPTSGPFDEACAGNGRYVYIRQEVAGYLNLREVEVYTNLGTGDVTSTGAQINGDAVIQNRGCFVATNYPGNDITNIPNVADEFECQALCVDNPSCQFFTYHTVGHASPNVCYLKTAANALTSLHTLSGPKQCGTQPDGLTASGYLVEPSRWVRKQATSTDVSTNDTYIEITGLTHSFIAFANRVYEIECAANLVQANVEISHPLVGVSVWDGATMLSERKHNFVYAGHSSEQCETWKSAWIGTLTSGAHTIKCKYYVAAVCNEDNLLLSIPYSQASASSTWTGDAVGTGWARGALDEPVCWLTATNNANQWWKWDLGADKIITGLVTQGRPAHGTQWVTSYKVAYSTDDISWSFIDSGTAFTGNTDGATKVQNNFTTPALARYVRVDVVTWGTHIALRSGVLVCGGQGIMMGGSSNLTLSNASTLQIWESIDGGALP